MRFQKLKTVEFYHRKSTMAMTALWLVAAATVAHATLPKDQQMNNLDYLVANAAPGFEKVPRSFTGTPTFHLLSEDTAVCRANISRPLLCDPRRVL